MLENVWNEIVGNTIKDLRKQKGISQEELADSIDSHQVYISEIERGLKLPSLPVLYKIAHCLGFSLTELISLVENQMERSSKQ